MSLLGLGNDDIATGVSGAVWPARMQHLTVGPYAQLARQFEGEVWLDGGHNPHGARAACSFIQALNGHDPRPFGLVSGLLSTKDRSGFFEAFSDAKPFVVAVPVASSQAGVAPQDLVNEARRFGLEAIACDEPFKALQSAFARLGKGARILICGSLYLAGEVLAQGGMD
jgi:dihydrofolate synthase / folylpolyglutamate synthase